MRLWSLHPQYLDSKGLVAVWREGLLAQAVLKGETRGYKNHPQLDRFKKQDNPLIYLDTYLNNIYQESLDRGFNFNPKKLRTFTCSQQISVTEGQLRYELKHLRVKLKIRDRNKYQKLTSIDLPSPNPLFYVIPGDVEPWEKLKDEK